MKNGIKFFFKKETQLKNVLKFITSKRYRKYNSILKVPNFYIQILAPNLANIFYWIFYPLYLFCRQKKIYFIVNNIPNSTGHFMQEFDFFLRLTMNDRGKYILITTKSEISIGSKKAYNNLIHRYIINDFIFMITLPFLIRYEKITIDIGLSSIKRDLKCCKKITVKLNNFRFALPILKEDAREYDEIWLRLSNYYSLKSNTSLYNPMYELLYFNDQLIIKEFNILKDKFAVIQIKTIAITGTALPTDPETYIDTINYLKKNGYFIVFAGREKMPEIFYSYDVFNYSESNYANFYNDLLLIKFASIIISSASGFANIAATFNKPLVYSNQWNFVCPPAGNKTITVPCLFRYDNGVEWKFKDQIDYFQSRQDHNSEIPHSLNPRNASSIEILSATKEAIEVKKLKITVLQENFKKSFSNYPINFSDARISSFFIQTHNNF